MSIQNAIDEALQLIADDTWKQVDRAVQAANAEASLAGRVASDAHNRMVTDGASQAFGRGVDQMVEKIVDFAGVKAPKYADTLADVADRLQLRMVEAHKARLETLERGKYKGVMQHEALFMGNFSAALSSLRDQAVARIRHTLADPEDSLSFWERHRRDIWLGLINALISAAVAAIVSWIVASLSAAPPSP